MQQNWIRREPIYTKGRQFAIGDIHGCYRLLRRRLEEVGFDPTCDIAYPVGDLVDRGPESEEALEWLAQPWFRPSTGNHEAFILKLYKDGNPTAEALQEALAHESSGFDWWGDTSRQFRQAFIQALAKLPIATELETNIGRVGLVHADVPKGMPWDEISTLINDPDIQKRRLLLSQRDRFKEKEITPVPGIERVYVGHNVTKKVEILGNIVNLDTGAYYGRTKKWKGSGQLSVVRVDVTWDELRSHIENSRPGKGLVIP